MSKIIVDKEVIKSRKMTESQFFLLLSLYYRPSSEDYDKLIRAQLIDKNLSGSYFTTNSGGNFINDILLKSIKVPKSTMDSIEKLAESLVELFPKGKKDGTNNYWRGNKREIRDRLIVFFQRNGNYNHKDVIAATKKYVDSFGDDLTLMRTLKYFIFKKMPDGSFSYDLLTFLENLNQPDDVGTNFKTSNLIYD